MITSQTYLHDGNQLLLGLRDFSASFILLFRHFAFTLLYPDSAHVRKGTGSPQLNAIRLLFSRVYMVHGACREILARAKLHRLQQRFQAKNK